MTSQHPQKPLQGDQLIHWHQIKLAIPGFSFRFGGKSRGWLDNSPWTI